MALCITEKEFEELARVEFFDLHQSADVRHLYDSRFGAGEFHIFSQGSGVQMYLHQLNSTKDLEIHYSHEQGFYFCNFRLSGFSRGRWDTSTQVLSFEGGVSTFGYFVGRGVKYFPKGVSCQEVTFLIEKEVISRWLDADHPLLEEIDKNSGSSWRNFRQGRIEPLERLILEQILHLDASLPYRKIYLESKILELFAHRFSLWWRRESSVREDHLPSLLKAKEIWLASLENPPTIKDVAYRAAINEFDLKKGFKALFGATPYEMIQQHRLELAKRLLVEEELDVQEVAKRVGYSSLSHFGKIFHERFGLLPRELKRG